MKDKELILISLYHPNTAVTNRFLAFAKAYGELDIKTKVYFIELSNSAERLQDNFKNVDVSYIPKILQTKNKYLRIITTLLSIIYLSLRIKKNSKVIMYSGFDFMWLLRLRKDLKIYHERTEHPDVVGRREGVLGSILHRMYVKACRQLDGLFVISPSLKAYFVDSWQLDSNKVHIVNMVVDSKRFESIELIDMKNSITYCGTISIRKDGILDLIYSFKVISKSYKDLKLTIIGGFEDRPTKEIVLKLVDELSLSGRVNFLGEVSSEEMPVFLASSGILALARPESQQAKYGFATKLGEYLLSNVPSVITSVGDFPLYLQDRKNIIFAKPDNVKDFADQLVWVVENYPQACEIAQNGRATAMQFFNYQKEAHKVINNIFKNEQ